MYLCNLKIAIMKEVIVKDSELRKAAESADMDVFVGIFIDAIKAAIGGELDSDNINDLNAEQITLLAWDILHSEVMDGGVVQLIHNGYGAFIWLNPTDKAFRNWGMQDLYKWINKSHRFYVRSHEEIEKDCSEDEFMALFEKFPEFDDYDDDFVENEEQWTMQVAHYIDAHIEDFAKIKD